MEYAKSDIN